MADYLIQESTLDAIARAINDKAGTQVSMTPAQMVQAINAISRKETLSWNQCPAAVRNYLAAAQVAYPSNDNVTVIDQYAPSRGNEVVANTKPVAYVIDGVTFRDNVPLVATPFATANEAGTLTALDALRWINTTPTGAAAGSEYPRGVNCRDLGGWPCDGGTIKYGMLVRGGEPNPADKELMVDKIGIKTEVQLLPLSEQATDYKMKSAWGIDWTGNDTENNSVYTLADSKELWKKLLEPIMDSVIHAKPVYFHCGVGADRTGMIASALEGLLGVNRADIDMEYELTNFAIGWQSLSGGIYRARTYTGYVAIMNQLANVPLLYGLADTFRNKWVSFVLSCGIDIDKINAFRVACIDGTPDEIVVNIPTYTNWIKQATAEISGSALYNGTGYKDGYRLNSSGAEVASDNSFVTGYIPVQGGDTVHFYGNIWSGVSGGWYTKCYTSDGSIVASTNPYDFATEGQVSPNDFQPYDYDSTNHVLHSFTIPSGKNIVAVRFTLAGSYVEGSSIITVNEEVNS